jgi:hypothetical protein
LKPYKFGIQELGKDEGDFRFPHARFFFHEYGLVEMLGEINDRCQRLIGDVPVLLELLTDDVYRGK